MSYTQPDFDVAVEHLASQLKGNAPAASGDDLRVVFLGLRQMLQAQRPYVPLTEADDAASEALARFAEAVTNGRFDSGLGRPAAYLVTIARHVAIDRLRAAGRRPRQEPLGAEAERVASDDDIAGWLADLAEMETVRQGLSRALAAGDYRLVAVIARWLDLAEANGSPPASREVAEAAKISHTTVNHALRRFREYLPERDRGS